MRLSTHPQHDFMENYRKLSFNYHQVPTLSVPLKMILIYCWHGIEHFSINLVLAKYDWIAFENHKVIFIIFNQCLLIGKPIRKVLQHDSWKSIKYHAFVMYFCCALLHQIYYHLAFHIKQFPSRMSWILFYRKIRTPEKFAVITLKFDMDFP